jgi:K+-transporting ATPase ATPase C chain
LSASSLSICSSLPSGWLKNFNEKTSHHRVSHDHRYHGLAGSVVSARHHRTGAGFIQGQGEWTDPLSERGSDGQPFTSAKYFHSRPSAAGNGYDAANSGGTNLASTNQKLIDRVQADAANLQKENPAQPIPVDLITTSASGLDPDISPAAAEFQIPRIARERQLSESALRDMVQKHTQPRQLGLLGEPLVNVLELNLALDELTAAR